MLFNLHNRSGKWGLEILGNLLKITQQLSEYKIQFPGVQRSTVAQVWRGMCEPENKANLLIILSKISPAPSSRSQGEISSQKVQWSASHLYFRGIHYSSALRTDEYGSSGSLCRDLMWNNQEQKSPSRWLCWLEHCPKHQKVVGLFPSQGTYRGQLIYVSLSHGCFSLSFSPSLSIHSSL